MIMRWCNRTFKVSYPECWMHNVLTAESQVPATGLHLQVKVQRIPQSGWWEVGKIYVEIYPNIMEIQSITKIKLWYRFPTVKSRTISPKSCLIRVSHIHTAAGSSMSCLGQGFPADWIQPPTYRFAGTSFLMTNAKQLANHARTQRLLYPFAVM